MIFAVLLNPIGPLYAVLVALGAAFVSAIFAALVPKISKKFAASLTFWVITRAARSYSIEVEATGIDEQKGSVIIRLGSGANGGVIVGDKFSVINNASRQSWGVVQVINAEDTSCVCEVSDRINEEFWEEMESRVRRDPSPPAGVTYRRQILEGALEAVEQLLQSWRR